MKCVICNFECKDSLALIRHVKKEHDVSRESYYDKYLKKPNEGRCIVCGEATALKSYADGYRKYCCVKCKQKDWHSTFVNTCREKYGVDNPFQSDVIKQRIVKTNLERYGEEYPNHFSGTKYNNMMTQKYGENWISDMSKKGIETFRSKYGVNNPSNIPAVVDKAKKTKFENLYKGILHDAAVIDYDYNEYTIVYDCHKCGHVSMRAGLYKTRIDNCVEVCPNCNPIILGNESEQRDFCDSIRKFYNGELKYNDRKTLSGNHELDILLPKENIAIEFDGIYWHNELFKDKDYHLKKTEECENKGIQLIHVFENEWMNKPQIVLSRIKSLLNLNDRIYARKTTCKEISNAESEAFLEKNHLQGGCRSSFRYGLFYNDELVSVMTFGTSRFKKDEYELLRFANKINVNVIGGAAKLFKHFLTDHPEISKVISFADRRWSKGNLYEKLGFSLLEKTPVSYYYILKDGLHNRIEFQKHKLVNEGYDKNKSEHEIMLERGIYRIYDCGTLKYEFTRGQDCV